jgi:hypothetical protein
MMLSEEIKAALPIVDEFRRTILKMACFIFIPFLLRQYTTVRASPN